MTLSNDTVSTLTTATHMYRLHVHAYLASASCTAATVTHTMHTFLRESAVYYVKSKKG